jgi:hypothetical protein
MRFSIVHLEQGDLTRPNRKSGDPSTAPTIWKSQKQLIRPLRDCTLVDQRIILFLVTLDRKGAVIDLSYVL